MDDAVSFIKYKKKILFLIFLRSKYFYSEIYSVR